MEQLALLLHQHAIDTSTLTQLTARASEPIYHLQVPADQRASLWITLRDLVEETGHWPVLISDMYSLTRALERAAQQDLRPILDEAATLDLLPFLLAGTSYTHVPQPTDIIVDVLAALDQEYDYRDDDFVSYHPLRAEAETALSNATLWMKTTVLPLVEQLGLETASQPEDTHGRPADLILVPTTRCWEVAAFIPEYPAIPTTDSATSVRLLQDWHTRYGAEVVELGWSTLTLRAIRPPQTPDAAVVLAWEHTQYCADIPTLDIVQRAVQLTQGKAWSFWWD